MTLTDLVEHKHNKNFGRLIGRSPAMQQVYKHLRKAAKVDIPVLLEGETGTGKDLAAHALHLISDRSHGPYIPVNLGALPPTLITSELFGHEKGAFTGAVVRQKGKFEQARDGTIFLDEIESIDEKTQISLLRLIEEKKFYRLGGKRRIGTNARMTAASNQNLGKLVEQGSFRQDLFFRLDVFPITLPPLRKRQEDIAFLTAHFVLHYNQLLKKQITQIDPECLRMLENHSWPGNVRELRNVVQRAILMCEEEILTPEHLPPELQNAEDSTLPVLSFKIGTPLDKIERAVIMHTLDVTDNNRTEAAKLLGISRRALYNKLKKYHIQ
ncbi:AAA domain-containing protein [candidate division KSB3 bacterium]|uniref:AAA domain-containing protein n=1 Tax=candidate division KSB3 bacterium TaxID=2044937 RepID=A0A9D5JTP5_9BACT|nr:AAA domain-containing protein [candidate division KSB3 bacterium]MBD3323990.1 AAA domain-containing protein [candidate division KSB3 bacterium]